jgi:hypothetical protein
MPCDPEPDAEAVAEQVFAALADPSRRAILPRGRDRGRSREH